MKKELKSKKGYKSNPIISILALVCLATFIVNGFVISKKNLQINNLMQEYNSLETSHFIQSFNDSLSLAVQSRSTISGFTLVEHPTGDQIFLKDIIAQNTVVYRYSKISCNDCVEKELILIKNLIDLIGIDRIVLLTDYDNISELYRFQRINNIQDMKVYLSRSKDFNLYPEHPTIPYYLVLDQQLQIKSFFVPTNDEANLSSLRYYRLIARHFFSEGI